MDMDTTKKNPKKGRGYKKYYDREHLLQHGFDVPRTTKMRHAAGGNEDGMLLEVESDNAVEGGEASSLHCSVSAQINEPSTSMVDFTQDLTQDQEGDRSSSTGGEVTERNDSNDSSLDSSQVNASSTSMAIGGKDNSQALQNTHTTDDLITDLPSCTNEMLQSDTNASILSGDSTESNYEFSAYAESEGEEPQQKKLRNSTSDNENGPRCRMTQCYEGAERNAENVGYMPCSDNDDTPQKSTHQGGASTNSEPDTCDDFSENNDNEQPPFLLELDYDEEDDDVTLQENDIHPNQNIVNDVPGDQVVQIEPNLSMADDLAADPGNESTVQAEGDGQIVSGDENSSQRKPFWRLQEELEGGLQERIDTPVIAKQAEVVLNALELARQHNWNHTEKSNLFKLINSIFGDKVFKDSRFLLDELLFSKEDMTYHFYCVKCNNNFLDFNFNDKTVETIKCPNTQVKVLRETSHFVTFHIAKQLEFLFKNERIRKELRNPLDYLDLPEDNNLTDIFNGSAYKAFAKLLDNLSSVKYLSFTICLDGSPLYKSSKCSIWPCFLMINELPIVLRMSNLLVVGLWFGNSKANMDLFLKPIVANINLLSKLGFSISFGDRIEHFKAYLITCCVDSGARGEVQGIHMHRGEFSCNWCLHPGEEWEGSRRFRFQYPFHEERSLHQMLRDWELSINTGKIINGCKFPSHLASAINFNIVDGMIFDYMHTVCEGNTKTFFKEWLSATIQEGEREDAIKKINERLKKVRPPLEFRKGIRLVDDLAYWTGREWENFLLFLSICMLIDILPDVNLKNWTYHVQAMHLLLNTDISQVMLNTAHSLLIEFVAKAQFIYGIKMMSFNLHLMLHAASNARRWGNLFAVSAFAFEHGIQGLKHVITANKGIANQVCRAVSQDRAMAILRNSLSSRRCDEFAESIKCTRVSKMKKVGNVTLIGTSRPYSHLSDEELFFCEKLDIDHGDCQVCSVIRVKGWTYSKSLRKCSTDNSVAWAGKPHLIKKFVFDTQKGNVWVVCSVVTCTPYLCPVMPEGIKLNCHHLLKVTAIDEDLSFFPASELDGVFVNLEMPHGHFLSPVPNCFNIF